MIKNKSKRKNNYKYIEELAGIIPLNYAQQLDEGTLRDFFVRYIILWNDKTAKFAQSIKPMIMLLLIVVLAPIMFTDISRGITMFSESSDTIKFFYYAQFIALALASCYPFFNRFYLFNHDINRNSSNHAYIFWMSMIGVFSLQVNLIAEQFPKNGLHLVLGINGTSIVLYLILVILYYFVCGSKAKDFKDRSIKDLVMLLVQLKVFTEEMSLNEKSHIIKHLIQYYENDINTKNSNNLLSPKILAVISKIFLGSLGAVSTASIAYVKVSQENMILFGIYMVFIIIVFGMVHFAYKTQFVETGRLANESNNGLILTELYKIQKTLSI